MGAYLIFDSKTVKPYLPSMAHLIHRYCPSDRIESENRGAGAATYEEVPLFQKECQQEVQDLVPLRAACLSVWPVKREYI